jgi:hypothetical protein
MNRPIGVTIAAVLTFSGAMILGLTSCAFFAVGVMVVTGDEGRAPVSEAIAGMAIAGAFVLLILALATGFVAVNIAELRDWARTVSFAEIADSARERLLSVIASIAAVRRAWFVEFVSAHKGRPLEHHPWRRV